MMFLKKNFFLFLLLSIFSVGFISLYLGQDLNWDLQNYHYYNGYVFFNLKITDDFFAAGPQSYLNPYIDAFNYLLIKFLPPKMTGFLLGAIQGLNFYILGILTWFYLGFLGTLPKQRMVLAILISLLGLLSANVLGEIGTTFNDLTISSLILLSLLIIWYSKKSKYLFLLAGACLGIATGIKLTNGFYMVAGIIACAALDDSFIKNIQSAIIFMFGGIVGFFLIDGYWMVKLYHYFQSPIFPYYNTIFKSPYFDLSDNSDERWFPHGLFNKLFFPFHFAWHGGVTEVPFRDFRLPIVYGLLMGWAVKYFFLKRKRAPVITNREKSFQRYLIVFFIISYIVWQIQFSALRYIIALDILAPLIIYICLRKIFSSIKTVNLLFVLISIFLIVSLKPLNWGRAPWTQSYFDLNFSIPIDIQKKGLILVGGAPNAFIRPFFPNDWRFITVALMSPNLGSYSPILNNFLENLKSSKDYQWYLLTQSDLEANQISNQYGFKIVDSCNKIISKVDRPYILCKIAL